MAEVNETRFVIRLIFNSFFSLLTLSTGTDKNELNPFLSKYCLEQNI